jgi:Holliday junction resolvase-like predicted endonuclease
MKRYTVCMVKVFTSETQKLGELGESLACRFLMKHGYSIVERNFTVKWGEIDIVASKMGTLHFIEVKSGLGSCETLEHKKQSLLQNVHVRKQQRLAKAIELYWATRSVSPETDWQIDIALVIVDQVAHTAKIELIEGIIFDL